MVLTTPVCPAPMLFVLSLHCERVGSPQPLTVGPVMGPVLVNRYQHLEVGFPVRTHLLVLCCHHGNVSKLALGGHENAEKSCSPAPQCSQGQCRTGTCAIWPEPIFLSALPITTVFQPPGAS